MNHNIFPINIFDKNQVSGNISVSGKNQVMKYWYKTLVEKTLSEVMKIMNEAIKSNPNFSYRIIKIDNVVVPGCEKTEPIDKNRINLTLETVAKFNNDMIQKHKRINTWLALPQNRDNARVINVEIY